MPKDLGCCDRPTKKVFYLYFNNNKKKGVSQTYKGKKDTKQNAAITLCLTNHFQSYSALSI